MIEHTEPLKLGASMIVRLIRGAYETKLATCPAHPRSKHDARLRAKYVKLADEAALVEAAICFTGSAELVDTISPEWRERFLKIAHGEATIVGWSHTGFTYHDDPNADYIPARDDHGKASTLAVWRAPTVEETTQRIVDKWIAIAGAAPDESMLAIFRQTAEHDADAWQQAEEIARELLPRCFEPRADAPTPESVEPDAK